MGRLKPPWTIYCRLHHVWGPEPCETVKTRAQAPTPEINLDSAKVSQGFKGSSELLRFSTFSHRIEILTK